MIRARGRFAAVAVATAAMIVVGLAVTSSPETSTTLTQTGSTAYSNGSSTSTHRRSTEPRRTSTTGGAASSGSAGPSNTAGSSGSAHSPNSSGPTGTGSSGSANPGNPTNSAGSPDATGVTGLPRHVLSGYWQNYVSTSKPLRLSDVPDSYDVIAVAFARANPRVRGAVTFDVDPHLAGRLDGYDDGDLADDIAAKHADGKKVILSIGGANGRLTVDNPATASNFATSVNALIRRYGFDGVDIDLEHGINPTYLSRALHKLIRPAGGLVITLAPSPYDMLPGHPYYQLASNISDILTMVNTQYYGSGLMTGFDGSRYADGSEDFVTALAYGQLANGIPANKLGIGVPAAGSSDYLSPSTVDGEVDCLITGSGCGSFTPQQPSQDVRGAMIWSINADASSGYPFANTVGRHLHAIH